MRFTCAGPIASGRRPSLALPVDSCDSHCHVLGPLERFPYAPEAERTYTPPEAPIEQIEAAWELLGITRGVIVQSVTHGNDHSAVIDALRRGGGRFRGVALVSPETAGTEIAGLDSQGFCGARLNFMPDRSPVVSREEALQIAAMIREFDWHVAFHTAGNGVAEHEDLIRAIPTRVVIDHMGRVVLRDGLRSPAIVALKRLLDLGNVWVKLSGADRIAGAPPSMDDGFELARILAEHAPERVVWGSDYPHVNTSGFVPDDADLVDGLQVVAPTSQALQRILVDNPTECFGFAN